MRDDNLMGPQDVAISLTGEIFASTRLSFLSIDPITGDQTVIANRGYDLLEFGPNGDLYGLRWLKGAFLTGYPQEQPAPKVETP